MSTCSKALFGLASLALAASWSSSADAYCTNGRKWSGPVPVYIVESGANASNLSGLRSDTFRDYVQSALQEVNTAAGGKVRLYFAGAVASADHGADGITIYTSFNASLCGAGWVGCTYGSLPDV